MHQSIFESNNLLKRKKNQLPCLLLLFLITTSISNAPELFHQQSKASCCYSCCYYSFSSVACTAYHYRNLAIFSVKSLFPPIQAKEFQCQKLVPSNTGKSSAPLPHKRRSRDTTLCCCAHRQQKIAAFAGSRIIFSRHVIQVKSSVSLRLPAAGR